MAELDFRSTDTFDPGMRGWSAKNARALMHCCELAYKDEGAVKDALANQNLEFGEFLDEVHTQGFLAVGNGFSIICYRGTQPDNLFDWATDANATQIPTPAGNVHRGFNDALNAVWNNNINRILPFIKSSLSENRHIFVTGHSLGGALACLTVGRALSLDEPIPAKHLSLYTYGQPRVGDTDFVKAIDNKMDDRIVRVVNKI